MNQWILDNVVQAKKCGAAGTAAIVTPNHIVIANVGDSPGIVYDTTSRALTATVDHDCENPDEVTRLNAIYMAMSNSNRGKYGLPCVDTYGDGGIRLKGQLAMSRSFGDFMFLPYITAEPTTYVIPRAVNQRLIMSSDSFTEGIAPSRTGRGNAIKNILTREQIVEEVDPEFTATDESLVKKVEKIVTNRVNKFWFPGSGYAGDNTTFLAINLPNPPVNAPVNGAANGAANASVNAAANAAANAAVNLGSNYFGFNSPKATLGGRKRSKKSRRHRNRRGRATRKH